MIQLTQAIRSAYDARDRDALEQALKRIEDAIRYTGPVPKTNDERLEVIDLRRPAA